MYADAFTPPLPRCQWTTCRCRLRPSACCLTQVSALLRLQLEDMWSENSEVSGTVCFQSFMRAVPHVCPALPCPSLSARCFGRATIPARQAFAAASRTCIVTVCVTKLRRW